MAARSQDSPELSPSPHVARVLTITPNVALLAWMYPFKQVPQGGPPLHGAECRRSRYVHMHNAAAHACAPAAP